ncbi:NUDIX domain-containing protein [Actinokineospora inagensis]|uniref:NUDIX domain-containing protein n=1 Tax=Actinokineospora inagensis TaxID=103730 RepID=UPI0004786FB8|nr:NUDIX domain-containing protein [Actinokineospora inagensis]
MRNSYCSYCGSQYPQDLPWPRQCQQCGQTSYLNPTPVAVLLLPVDDALLVVQRDIEPKALALPGGFVDYGESWREAAARELREEANIDTDPQGISLFDTVSAPDSTLLVFGVAAKTTRTALPASIATNETRGWELIHGPVQLAFPLHTDAVARYFGGR